jgi:hypothetical protein
VLYIGRWEIRSCRQQRALFAFRSLCILHAGPVGRWGKRKWILTDRQILAGRAPLEKKHSTQRRRAVSIWLFVTTDERQGASAGIDGGSAGSALRELLSCRRAGTR